MPKTANGIGYSPHTEEKQASLAAVFEKWCFLWRSIAKKHGFFARQALIYDVTAGCGSHPETGERGSPLILLDTALQARIPFDLVCIERDEQNCLRLAVLLAERLRKAGFEKVERRGEWWQGDRNRVRVLHGDHNQIFPALVDELPEASQALGFVYFDFPQLQGDVDAFLSTLAVLQGDERRRKKVMRLDYNLYLKAVNFKRARSISDSTRWLPLSLYLRGLGKRHWNVRVPAGPGQYTLLQGCNWENMPTLTASGFRSIYQPDGFRVLLDLSVTAEGRNKPYRTYEEYLQHPCFNVMRDAVMMRAEGRCEVCKKKKVRQRATQVHHRFWPGEKPLYPPWGEFDPDPRLLQAVCDTCHRQYHNIQEKSVWRKENIGTVNSFHG
jgi:hypothetical protein